jgi:putative DNA primase/helicase
MLFGTPGGIVDLKSGKLLPPDPTAYITKLAGCTPTYSPPQRWLRFLNECMAGDAETVRYLQRVAGYCLTGLTTEHALLFIYGPGGNGKSVFLNTVAYILGQHAMTAAMETFTASAFERHSTDLAMLKGARLVTASETEEGRSWAESRIKQMTGGDPITARFMRRDNFTYTPQFKLLIVGNHAPLLRNVDDAMRRRFNIIPFLHRPSQPDPDLEGKLKAEAGAILQWAIEGCLEWQRIGLAPPAAVRAATANYFNEQDTFGSWFNLKCTDVRQREPHAFCTAKELFESWCSYARELGEDPGSAKRFGASMAKHGFQSRVARNWSGVAKVYDGIRLGGGR